MGESISASMPEKPVQGTQEDKKFEQNSTPVHPETKAVSASEAESTQSREGSADDIDSLAVSKRLYEQAVEDAQYLMAYASGKCPKDIKRETIEKLIKARQLLENKQDVDPKVEADFWLAYQELWKLVSPVTAECIKATENPAIRKTINRYIVFTGVVLGFLLFFQIYWVIGNQLTTQLADLEQQESVVSNDIAVNQEEYSSMERRFKENEMKAPDFTGTFAYPYSIEFERDTAPVLAKKATLETKLTALESQRVSKSTFLWSWSRPWHWLINSTLTDQNNELTAKIESNRTRINEIKTLLQPYQSDPMKAKLYENIAENESKLETLNQNPDPNQAEIAQINVTLSKLYNDAYNLEQMQQELSDLQDQNNSLELQKTNQANQEKSRQTYLSALFMLIIFQSYLLPLLYGLLGASTSALRSLSREIDQVIFSDKKRIQHLLRIALGALSGIMVGWFSFLLPNESGSFVGSVSPLAIAFLVGYNIELFFSLMDMALNSVKKLTRNQDESDAGGRSAPATT
jgi:hypothetical protein